MPLTQAAYAQAAIDSIAKFITIKSIAARAGWTCDKALFSMNFQDVDAKARRLLARIGLLASPGQPKSDEGAPPALEQPGGVAEEKD